MKRIFTLLLVLSTCIAYAQTVVFFDDFESGTGSWVLSGSWGTTTSYSYSSSTSLTESPTGNYQDQITISATMATSVNLSSAVSADVSFYGIHDIESNFDYMYLEISTNNGLTWTSLASFTGDNQLSPWVQYTYSLGGYVGSSNVKLRFRFESDQGVNEDGMYIDDFKITTYTTDVSPPLIQHTAPVHYESNTGSQSLTASIVDVSGISEAKLFYTVDGGAMNSITGINTIGNNFVFVIPSQSPGSWVDYYIRAIDNSTASNADSTPVHKYITGNYVKYDNGQVDFVNSAGPAAQSNITGMAVKITLNQPAQLVTALIRNYTDPTRPNDSMMVHIWSSNNGVPGTDLITPFMVNPEATLSNPNPMTRVDLRPYASQLTSVSGDIFVGFTVPVGEVWTTQTTPGIAGRTYVFNGSIWNSITDDYHFRVITGPSQGAPAADFSFNTITDPQVVFADLSTNNPTNWFWDFDDNGMTSTQQNPIHTFSENRVFNVCLTASNSAGSTSTCKLVTVTGVPPVAAFTWSAANDPQIDFTDTSPDSAISWAWDFGDGSQSTQQHPVHVYNSNGAFLACLTITTAWGTSDPYCDSVKVFKVGISEQPAELKLDAFPNPFSGSFFVNVTDEVGAVELYDATGRLVPVSYELNRGTVKIGARLAAGFYTVRIRYTDGSSGSARLVAY